MFLPDLVLGQCQRSKPTKAGWAARAAGPAKVAPPLSQQSPKQSACTHGLLGLLGS